VWGLAYEISSTSWFWYGLGMTVIITFAIGWLIVRGSQTNIEGVASLALAASLLLTPYTWPYDHALLLVPFVFIYLRMTSWYQALVVWIGVTMFIPWYLFCLASQRGIDTLSCLVPLTAMAILGGFQIMPQRMLAA
jgi:hypothetical protein